MIRFSYTDEMRPECGIDFTVWRSNKKGGILEIELEGKTFDIPHEETKKLYAAMKDHFEVKKAPSVCAPKLITCHNCGEYPLLSERKDSGMIDYHLRHDSSTCPNRQIITCETRTEAVDLWNEYNRGQK